MIKWVLSLIAIFFALNNSFSQVYQRLPLYEKKNVKVSRLKHIDGQKGADLFVLWSKASLETGGENSVIRHYEVDYYKGTHKEMADFFSQIREFYANYFYAEGVVAYISGVKVAVVKRGLLGGKALMVYSCSGHDSIVLQSDVVNQLIMMFNNYHNDEEDNLELKLELFDE